MRTCRLALDRRLPAVVALCLLSFVSARGQITQSAPPLAADPVSSYVLGPGDQISLQVIDADEISGKPFRIDVNGYLRMPVAGRILAAGLTVEQLERAIADRLKEFIKQPEVVVTVLDYRSQPVSILGSVKSPGVHQLQGRKTLVEVISEAGGIGDDAGHSVKIVRRIEWGRVPLPSAKDDETGRFSVAEVSLERILEATNPQENIVVCPEDVITVPRGEMVYVVGQVVRAGGFVLRERQSLSVLQAYSLAGGADKGSSPKKARILRAVAGGSDRAEIPVDITRLLSGKAPDVPLRAEDILFVPASNSKKALSRLGEAAAVAAAALVYRLP